MIWRYPRCDRNRRKVCSDPPLGNSVRNAVRNASAPVTVPKLAGLLLALLSGCATGPDFQAPEAPRTKQYGHEPTPRSTASAAGEHGEAQQLLAGRDIPLEWWSLFHSKELDGLVQQGLAGSPTLGAAVAALQAANENYSAVAGTAYFPQLDASFEARRQKITGATFGGRAFTFNLFTASLALSYDLDVAGGQSREVEAAGAEVEYERFQLEAAYLSLTSNIAAVAIQDASLRASVAATNDILKTEQEQLDIVQRRFELGALTQADVLAQRTRVSQTRVLLPPLEKALAQNRHLLAILLGKLPSEATLPEFDLAKLKLPEELPVSLPSVLAKQRPDIRAAQALLHQACAGVGVATADLYPRITLTGEVGSQASLLDDLFKSASLIWGIGADVLQPIFHGGELRARRRAAIATFNVASARYRNTVLHAFQEVADVLHAIESDASALDAQAQAATDARNSLQLAQEQLRVGAVSYLTLLDAQRQYEQTQVALVQARAARFLDTVALFQALGGGWWNRVHPLDSTDGN